MTWVKHLLAGALTGPGGIEIANAPNVKITPVLDLAGQAPVDAYEIPARLRQAVRVLHPGDVFPCATSLSRRVDLDHGIPYADGGPTAIDNLSPLTRTHHRIKTHHRENGGHGWEVRHPFPGIIVWRDPYGAHYLIDATGTRQVTGNTATGDTVPRTGAPSPRLDPYQRSDLTLDLAA